MTPKTKLSILLGSLSIALASPAFAEKYEVSPNFANCGDGSYNRAFESGAVLGISRSRPMSWSTPRPTRSAASMSRS